MGLVATMASRDNRCSTSLRDGTSSVTGTFSASAMRNTWLSWMFCFPPSKVAMLTLERPTLEASSP